MTNYDYGFRIYNPGISRFLSVDPLTKEFPFYTPYQFAGNMPISAIDLDGLEPKLVTVQEPNFKPVLDAPNMGTAVSNSLHNTLVFFPKVATGLFNTAVGGVNGAVGLVYGEYNDVRLGDVAMRGNDVFNHEMRKWSNLSTSEQLTAVGDAATNLDNYKSATEALILMRYVKLPEVNSYTRIDPRLIRFSQTSVNDVAAIEQSMRKNGWVGAPIDVIKMEDGMLTTMDNTRVLAASRAGIDVRAIIHSATERLTPEEMKRFTVKNKVPQTWGDAINFRIKKQNADYRSKYPNGSQITGSKE